MPASAFPSIAVIIVNYGTADLVIEGVESVLARTPADRPVEIHVLDNASPGDDAAVLTRAAAERGWGARVTLHLETENHGFGRGNNVVLDQLTARAAPPDHVFLLNPDARLENDVLALLSARLDADPRVGMAGAGIALPDGTPVTAAFRFPNARAEFSDALNFGPVSRRFARHTVPLPPDQPEGPVDWVAGAAVLMRFSMLRETGFFDPVYFLYYEEVDLMRRARAAGWTILYVPEARVVHAEGAATDQKSHRAERRRRPAYWYDSWRHYYLGNHGRGGAIRAGLAWMAGAALNYPLALLRGQEIRAPARFFPDFWGKVMWPLIAGRAPSAGGKTP
jgi:GT2 family glycosyltransferase